MQGKITAEMFVEEGNVETKKELQALIDNLRSKDYFFYKTTHFRYSVHALFLLISQESILENSFSLSADSRAVTQTGAGLVLSRPFHERLPRC
jgi:hypothetical protein